jgi:tripeptide aminopeptidase
MINQSRTARKPSTQDVSSNACHGPESNGAPIEPHRQRALDLVMELMAIPGTSGEEAEIAQRITERLLEAGAPRDSIQSDQAHRRSKLKGNVGNLVFKLPGTLRKPRRMLMAHMDTVPLCIGSKPVLKNGWVHSSDPATGLGADDRAGSAVVLNTALEILRQKLPHPPLTFFWTVQEEVGLLGARHANLGMLGRPRLAFNWDGGPAEKITLGATGAYRLEVKITGLASHAGGAPEQGISAISVAGLAIADLQRNGWHGDVHKGNQHGTSNIGFITGGRATNVVTPEVRLRAECRSHDPKFRARILREFENAFRRAAREVRSVDRQQGQVEIHSEMDYDAFKLPDNEPAILAAEAAIASLGHQPVRAVCNGGLDANWMTVRGLPTVTMGCGQQNVHTVAERLDVAAFHTACRVGLRLAMGIE